MSHNPQRRCFWTCLVLSLSLYLFSSTRLSFVDAAQPPNQDWKERFLSEAPEALRELERYYAQSVFTYSLALNLPRPGGPGEKIAKKVDFAANNNLFTGRMTGPVRTTVAVVNPRYKARLMRQAHSSQYALTEVLRNQPTAGADRSDGDDDDSDMDAVEETQTDIVIESTLAPCYFLDRPLSARIPTFAADIEKAYPVIRDGKTLVRVDFRSKPLVPRLAPRYLLLDPESKWCLHEYEGVKAVQQRADQQLSVNVKVKMLYGPPVDGFPRLRQRDQAVEVNNSGHPELRRVVIESLEHKVVSESEFSLAPYGLAEPNPGVGKISMGVMYFIAAVVLGILTLGLMRYFQKKRRLKTT